jgi:hypothetical protein
MPEERKEGEVKLKLFFLLNLKKLVKEVMKDALVLQVLEINLWPL